MPMCVRRPSSERGRNAYRAAALSRLSATMHEPTAIGVFRAVDRVEYAGAVQRQLVDASERRGPGDLRGLLRSGGTWNVG